MKEPNYKILIDHYESCFKEYGDSHKGVDAPNLEDHLKRYEVTLQIISKKYENVTILDFGCGTAMLYEYILGTYWKEHVAKYTGLDLGETYINHCKTKFKDIDFYNIDILLNPDIIPNFDYVLLQGVFTEKRELSFDDMWTYFTSLLTVVFKKANIGISFNVMAKAVDWEREDLFHVPMDLLAKFLTTNISRNFVIRNDYGLYEYTVYVYKEPQIR